MGNKTVIAGLLGLFVAIPGAYGSANASGTQPRPGAKSMANPKRHTPKEMKLWGTIQSVDTKTETVSIKDKRGKTHALQVMPQTIITMGGNHEKIMLTDLRVGEHVDAASEGETADSIHVNLKSAIRTHVARAKSQAKTAATAN